MTPKEKAKELFNKMDMVVGGGNYDAKEYASIAVDEIIKECHFVNKIYWQEVKSEIEKL
jgi:hypothetical protein